MSLNQLRKSSISRLRWLGLLTVLILVPFAAEKSAQSNSVFSRVFNSLCSRLLGASEQRPDQPLLRDLAFPSPALKKQKVRDLHPRGWLGKNISPSLNREQRWELIREFPISELVANPGHRIVRNPEAIDEIAELIRRGNFPPDLSEKSPAINIVTDEDHRLQYVDVWEGHHRMLAHLTAGNLTLGHLNFEELRIYINGELASDYTGKSRPHLVPSYGVDFEKSPDWFPLHPVEDRDPGKTYQTRPDPKNEGKKKDIIVDARNSNYSLGSRESLQHVLENIRTRSERRVGILWLDLTRGIPDADAVLALPAEAPEPITDLVLIPQEGEFSRTQLNEIDQLRRKVLARKPTLFLNAYVGPESGEFARKHGKENLVKRIQQAFLTGSSSTL